LSRTRALRILWRPGDGFRLRGIRERSVSDIDMRMFARNAGVNVTFPAGSVVFSKGDAGNCMYIVQSGMIEMVIGETVVEVCGPNEAIGFMSMIDAAPRSSTARVKEPVELDHRPAQVPLHGR
jgi:CRP-like cAMP-binding protein